MSTLKSFYTHDDTESTLRGGCTDRMRDLPRAVQPHSKPTAQARSQVPPEFLLFSQSCARSPPGPSPTPGRASCTPRQHLTPAGGGRGAGSPDLTAPARKPAARRPPGLCRLTSSRRLGQRREGTSASRGSPAPFRRPPLWPGGAGPHSRAGPGARGGACRAAGFPPPSTAYCPLPAVPLPDPRGQAPPSRPQDKAQGRL